MMPIVLTPPNVTWENVGAALLFAFLFSVAWAVGQKVVAKLLG